MKHGGRREVIRRSRKLRREMSPTERRLWSVLKTDPGGHRFRKQHPCAWFTLDFFCPARALVVEVDGESHNRGDQPARDVRRDAWLLAHGLCTLRIPAIELLRDLQAVVTYIVTVADRRPLHGRPPPPPPDGGGPPPPPSGGGNA